MRHYLATLHKKPDHHKKRFALLVSASFTLFIFTVWSLVNFGLPTNESRIAYNGAEAQRTIETTPFTSLKAGVAAAFQAMSGGFGEIKQGLEQVNVNGEYQEMRNRAFDTYGR